MSEAKLEPVFAPREDFETILKYAVIPTFDLVVEVHDGPTGKTGVLIVRRRIQPYANVWALPGLRMYKNESIEDTLRRIARNEVGLVIDPTRRRILDQYVGRFRTEHNRQDLSTGYVVQAEGPVAINNEHFSSFRIITSQAEIPAQMGAMYRHYLGAYFSSRIR